MLLKRQIDTEMMVWITNFIIPIENNFIELNQKEYINFINYINYINFLL